MKLLKSRERMISSLVIFFVVFIFHTEASASERINGNDRYSTAVEISKKGWTTTDTVVLAKGTDFPDALAGGPLAYKKNAPILLTKTTTLPKVTKDEILRLKAKTVFILGSFGAVNLEVENELESLNLEIVRIGGNDRYETAALIAERIPSKKIVMANGENFPDALAIAPYAAKNGIPILLTKKDKLPNITSKALNGKEQSIILGGTGVINQAIERQLPNPKRYSGNDRYKTTKDIITKLPLGQEMIFLSSGENFPDALAGSVLAAKNNASMALVKSSSIPSVIYDELANYRKIHIIGGPSAISNEVLLQSKVKEIVKLIIKPNMSDLEKSHAVFRYMTENTSYDYTYSRYTAYDALIEGSAVCEGYTLATQILMKEAGIESIYVEGTLLGEGHAWNLIKLNNHYYHVDTTNNLFLLNDKTFDRNITEWDRSHYPQSLGPEMFPEGWNYFIIGNDVYYNNAHKINDFTQVLSLIKRNPDGKEEVVTTLEPGGWLLSYDNNWVYYGSRGNEGVIYRKNLSSTNENETIPITDIDGYPVDIDNFNVKNGWIYVKGNNDTHEMIIRVNPTTYKKEKLFELPKLYEAPVGKTYQVLEEVTPAEEWIFYSINTYLQTSINSGQIVSEKQYKMKLDGTSKTFLREFKN